MAQVDPHGHFGTIYKWSRRQFRNLGFIGFQHFKSGILLSFNIFPAAVNRKTYFDFQHAVELITGPPFMCTKTL